MRMKLRNDKPQSQQSPAPAVWVPALLVVLSMASFGLMPPVLAGTLTALASYEPSETDLTLTPHVGDLGLDLTIVPGGVGGVPPATDGAYVVKLDFAGEDGKVEFRHDWSSSTYDLSDQDELLADVYIETPSAIPGVMGVWSPNWNPPNTWQPASDLPTTTGVWTTVSIDVSERSQIGLDSVAAFILQNMPGADGTAYVDNLRFRSGEPSPGVDGVAAVGLADHNEIFWKPVEVEGLEGYYVYRAEAELGPFTRLNATPHSGRSYRDELAVGSPRYFYYLTSTAGGDESAPSATVSALYNGMTDDELLTLVQQTTLRYFWDYAHPNCGMAREGFGMGHSTDTVTTGGTGMGIISMVVGAERGFITRAAAASRIVQILTFLDETATRYHGAWAHHLNGVTGATIAFAGYQDNGGDLVETAFLVQGMLTARQYFDDPVDPVETELRARATTLWEGVEWDWYRQHPGSDVLYWHWSPDYGWALNAEVRGYNETGVTYLLAIASPTHPMPVTSWNNGWAGSGGYTNPGTFYGYRQWVGPDYGGALFFTHYSNLGFDPRYKRDDFCNYYDNARHISLIHREFSIDNPNGYDDYSALVWGLTASFNPWGYSAHAPLNDNGTITPTAAISAMPYTPEESLLTTRYYYDHYGEDLWGQYGFVDAFNPTESWFAPGYVAIDQGTIVPMIENYRSQLCWRLFMANPEIRPALIALGWTFSGDFDADGDVDLDDWSEFRECISGPIEITSWPPGCPGAEFVEADLDGDLDVDLADVAIFADIIALP